MQFCPHCGEEHSPTLCRQALSIVLAERTNDLSECMHHLARLELVVAEHERRLSEQALPHFHR